MTNVAITRDGKRWTGSVDINGGTVTLDARTARGLRRLIKRLADQTAFIEKRTGLVLTPRAVLPGSYVGKVDYLERLTKWQERLLREAIDLLGQPRKDTLAKRKAFVDRFCTTRPMRYF